MSHARVQFRLRLAGIASAAFAAVGAQAQQPFAVAREVLRAPAEVGGPQSSRAVLATGAAGLVAFTFGSDDDGKHVTVMDSTGRIVARVGGVGDGPGEFRSVLNIFLDSARVVLFGTGQLSEFSLTGRHRWSRAVPANEFAVALLGDSVDLMEASYFLNGQGVGDVRRQSTKLDGGGRILVAGGDPAIRQLARSVRDPSKFVRLAYAATERTVFLANGYTYEVQEIDLATATRRRVSEPRPPLRLTAAQVTAAVDAEVLRASRPFRLPDGTTRVNPVDRGDIRSRLEAPRAYFSARAGALRIDRLSGEVFVIESRDGHLSVQRLLDPAGPGVRIPCDAGDWLVAMQGRFLAAHCAVPGDRDGVTELRLYRLDPANGNTTQPVRSSRRVRFLPPDSTVPAGQLQVEVRDSAADTSLAGAWVCLGTDRRDSVRTATDGVARIGPIRGRNIRAWVAAPGFRSELLVFQPQMRGRRQAMVWLERVPQGGATTGCGAPPPG